MKDFLWLSIFEQIPFGACLHSIETAKGAEKFFITEIRDNISEPDQIIRLKTASQQQRHQLIQDIAAKPDRNLILLTATPHSGIEEAFLSLLGLLKPQFGQLSLDSLNEEQRKTLAQHFIQRRRADVKLWLGDQTPFPERESKEIPYKLSRIV